MNQFGKKVYLDKSTVPSHLNGCPIGRSECQILKKPSYLKTSLTPVIESFNSPLLGIFINYFV